MHKSMRIFGGVYLMMPDVVGVCDDIHISLVPRPIAWEEI